MTTIVCYDLMEMIGEQVKLNKIEKKSKYWKKQLNDQINRIYYSLQDYYWQDDDDEDMGNMIESVLHSYQQQDIRYMYREGTEYYENTMEEYENSKNVWYF